MDGVCVRNQSIQITINLTLNEIERQLDGKRIETNCKENVGTGQAEREMRERE